MKANRPTVMRIERAQPRGIVFSQSPLSNLSGKIWRRIVARSLELAFRGGPVCFITPSETASSWDLDWTDMVPASETYTIGGYPYFCAFHPAVDPPILRAVAESQDLYLGPVWMAPLTRAEKDRLFTLVEAKLRAGVFGWPETDEEFLYPNPDGDFVYWLNPSIAEKAILDELNRLAKDANWRVESEFAGR